MWSIWHRPRSARGLPTLREWSESSSSIVWVGRLFQPKQENFFINTLSCSSAWRGQPVLKWKISWVWNRARFTWEGVPYLANISFPKSSETLTKNTLPSQLCWPLQIRVKSKPVSLKAPWNLASLVLKDHTRASNTRNSGRMSLFWPSLRNTGGPERRWSHWLNSLENLL